MEVFCYREFFLAFLCLFISFLSITTIFDLPLDEDQMRIFVKDLRRMQVTYEGSKSNSEKITLKNLIVFS